MKIQCATDRGASSSWPYAATIFLSAFLLFQVQLVIGKYFLPWFGGTPAMWTTSMFFFQTLLFGGYLYAHALTKRVNPRAQSRWHLAALVCAFLLSVVLGLKWGIPILPGAAWKPSGLRNPVSSLVVLLAISVGAPYFCLSATGPLLQDWFAREYPGVSPYRLYSLSNLGSFLALLSYPIAVEPWLTLRMQARLWFAGFFFFVLFCSYCALQFKSARSTPASEIEPSAALESGGQTGAPGFAKGLFWFSLAACGSLLFLATTNQICQNVAVIPLLWILPLSIYLLSLAVCFDRHAYYLRGFFHPALAAAIVLAIFVLNGGVLTKLLFQICCYLLILFIACMVTHGELVRSRPSSSYLTLFYLMVAAGGAAAGMFVVLIAPRVFSTFCEYQIALWLTVFLMLISVILDNNSWVYVSRFGVFVIAITAAVLPGAITLEMHGKIGANYLFLMAIVVLGIYVVARKSRPEFSNAKTHAAVLFSGFAMLLLGVIFVMTTRSESQGAISVTRNFFGVLTVRELNNSDPEWSAYKLTHGLISHGFQFRSPSKKALPTSYYGEQSGAAEAISELRTYVLRAHSPRNLHFGVIGLGVGTLAAYAHPGDYMRFYEINPDVVRIARNPNYFTYLSDCPAALDVVPGDARLSMERELALARPQNFDLLAVDAFSGDAPPIHLLTEQAFRIYLSELAPDGIIAVHVTNTYLDLRPVVTGIAAALHLNSIFLHSEGDGRVTLYNDWVLVSRTRWPIFDRTYTSELTHRRNVRLWTDDYSNLFEALR